MSAEYKDSFLCALKQQQSNSANTNKKPYQQFMKMNGLKTVKKVSLAELLSSNGQSKKD